MKLVVFTYKDRKGKSVEPTYGTETTSIERNGETVDKILSFDMADEKVHDILQHPGEYKADKKKQQIVKK